MVLLKSVCRPISKLHSILAVANLLAHNNLWLCYYNYVSKFATAKIECSFKMAKETPLGVPLILLLMVHKFNVTTLYMC